MVSDPPNYCEFAFFYALESAGDIQMKRCFLSVIAIAFTFISGCSSLTDKSDTAVEKRGLALARTQALLSQGQYEVAYDECQRALQDGSADPDLALFNLGMVSAYQPIQRKTTLA